MRDGRRHFAPLYALFSSWLHAEWVDQNLFRKGVSLFNCNNIQFLGAFEELRKVTISFVMSARLFVRRLSACSESAPEGRIFVEIVT
jgi:hypothetical protein